MGAVSKWAVNRPKSAIGVWLAMVAIILGLAVTVGGSYNDSFSLPDTESTKAQALLEQIPGASDSFTAATAKVVWRGDGDALAQDEAVRAPIMAMLTTISEVPGVVCVTTPYGEPLGSGCAPAPADQAPADQGAADGATDEAAQPPSDAEAPAIPPEVAKVLAGLAPAGFSVDGAVGYAAVDFGGSISDLSAADAAAVLDAVTSANGTDGLTVGANGQALEFAGEEPPSSEGIGIAVALVILLFTFGSLVGAFLPVLSAVLSLGVAQALLCLFVMGINFFDGLAVASSATVLVMMVGATVLLPAVLSLLGRRAFALKLPWTRKPKAHNPEGSAFARYGRWLERHYRVAGAAGFGILLLVALPILSLRMGFPDDGGKGPEKPARIAYDLLSEGFGPGINGPFVVAVETATAGDNAAVQELAAELGKDPGVAAAIAFPMGPESTVTAMQVVPMTGPQDAETTQLLDRLRDVDIPPVTASGELQAYVGGTQAITADFTTVLADALPLFLLVVIGLGFLALVVLFRSIVVPLTGAITSLLSLGAAMGVTVAVFQWGWLSGITGVSGTGPIMPFLPIMVFAILFGLSMDYQVFLVSRMQEEWTHTHDNRKAVRRGLAASGRVVAIAAAIMFSVLAAFVPSTNQTIKLFGLSLASAVLFDAFIVRLIIVPSLMYQLGKINWWLPRWLERIRPSVSVESDEDVTYEEAEIDDIPDDDEPVVAGALKA